MPHFKLMSGILMLILFGVLFIAVTCKALSNTVVNIATLITLNIVIYMPDPLCSC